MTAGEEGYAAALADLPGMGPAALCRLLERASPQEAWNRVLSGEVKRPEPRRDAASSRPAIQARPRPWAQIAAAVDPRSWWRPFAEQGIGVTWRGRPDYPMALVADPRPPGVLFWIGDLGCLERRRVAIVGTRSATSDGLLTAFEMGRDLAAAGVAVVSGLALGIDGACHAGVLEAFRAGAGGMGAAPAIWAGPVGVAASGVDVPYPRQHLGLWRRVASSGLLLSETPPGRKAQAWMFPSRNRIIAGLAELVVVVESHRKGGSLITAEAAIERGRDVRVVPGPVRSPASEGSNQLLCDGPGPVRSATDVLDALGLFDFPAAPPALAGPLLSAPPADRTDLGPTERAVLGAMGGRPVGLEQLMVVTGLDVVKVQKALDVLGAAGLVNETRGWWSAGCS